MSQLPLLVIFLSIGMMLQGAQPRKTEREISPGPKHMRVSARHIEAGGIGYNRGYTTLEAFVASDPNQWSAMPFLDVRGHVFNDGKCAVNAGLGVRSIWGCRAYGINGYYDYRNTHHRGYNQVGLGLETLGRLWDLRVNGYLPVGGKVSNSYDLAFGGFEGHFLLVDRKYQYALKGIDGEAGFHFGKTASFEFYAAAGPYYFKGEMGNGALGGKGRIAGYYKEYATLEVSDSWDRVFKNNIQGQLTLTLPLGPKSKLKTTSKHCPDTCEFAHVLATRMVQPVARQEIVVVDQHTKTDTASDFFVFVNNLSSSAGTFESPYPTLSQAQDNSSPGDIIYVFAGDGTTTGMDAGIFLQDDQKFWGSGVGHSLATQFGVIYIPNLTAASPEITHLSGDAILLRTNNEISGFTIANAARSGVFGIDPGNFSLSSSTISACDQDNSGYFGIHLSCENGSTNVVMNDVSVINNLEEGIYIHSSGSSISVCLDMRGNNSSGNGSNQYNLVNASGAFNVAPCNAAAINTGGLFDVTTGVITHVESCPAGASCP